MKFIYIIMFTLATLPSYASTAYFNATDIFDVEDFDQTVVPGTSASGSLTYHLDSLANLILDDFSMITHNNTFTFDPSTFDPYTYGSVQRGLGSVYIGLQNTSFGSDQYDLIRFKNVHDFILGFNYDSATGAPLSIDQLAFTVDDGTVAWGSLNVQLSSSPVPVPAAFWLMGTGLFGLLGYSRNRDIRGQSRMALV